LICRSDRPVAQELRQKIALFSNVPSDAVFVAEDVPTIYALPLRLHAEGLDDKISELLNIWSRQPDLSAWERIVDIVTRAPKRVRIGVVGKYTNLVESYKSLNEA